MNQYIFLDTPIFFQCFEQPKLEVTLEHALNAGYEIRTSISVLGEAFTQMHEKENEMDYISALNRFLDNWNIAVHFPNDFVRILCFQMGEEDIDTRMIREPTDRTHLAYAMAYHDNYFLTSDKNLIKYRIPSKLQEAGFFKPDTMKLEEFKQVINSK
jgi:predicted nucleic acid-binding protein